MVIFGSSEPVSCRFVRYHRDEGAKSSFRTAYGLRHENVNAFVIVARRVAILQWKQNTLIAAPLSF